jgi:helicase MOV-10
MFTADREIGVIAPYHAQCQKIRKALIATAGDVKVGSVEEFQGQVRHFGTRQLQIHLLTGPYQLQERSVIIISTVRSSREFVQYDLKHTLGFVANPRRFNGKSLPRFHAKLNDSALCS